MKDPRKYPKSMFRQRPSWWLLVPVVVCLAIILFVGWAWARTYGDCTVSKSRNAPHVSVYCPDDEPGLDP
jgi:hypothetical protein